jgi:outer membrane protein TolC
VLRSRAPFDFRVGANVGYTREEQPLDFQIPGDTRDKEITAITNYGINATLPFVTGTSVEVTGGFVRRDTNSPFNQFEFFPEASITVRQQLLNGFGLVPNLGPTWIAEGNQQIADWQIDVARNTIAFNVAMAYWDLVEAQGALRVFLNQEELARDALSLAQQRLEAEIGTQQDVLTQQANLLATQSEIIQAEGAVDQRVDDLLRAMHPDLIHGYAMFENYRIVIEPLTEVDSSRAAGDAPPLMGEVQAALRHRPEIRQAQKRIENAGLSIEVSEYGLLPRLELSGTFGNEGSGATFDDSWETFFRFENLRYGFTLNFSVPLQNSAARADMTAAELNKRTAILAARDAETTVILEVATAVRAMRTARRAVDAAEERTRAERARHSAEQDRQRAGLATSFEVRQVLNDLTVAELELLRARISVERARMQMQKATGEMGR